MTKTHDLHHRLPRSKNGPNTKDNLVKVPQSLHRAWHLLFRNWLPPQIADELNNTWISNRWKMIAIPNGSSKHKQHTVYEDDDIIVVKKEK